MTAQDRPLTAQRAAILLQIVENESRSMHAIINALLQAASDDTLRAAAENLQKLDLIDPRIIASDISQEFAKANATAIASAWSAKIREMLDERTAP